MKIVSWNLNFGSKRDRLKLDFLKVLDDIGADVLLAQEMFIPQGCQTGKIVVTDRFSAFKYCLFNEIPTERPKENWSGSGEMTPVDKKWGTAILSKEPLDEVKLKFSTAYPGTLSVARVDDICLISMYGKLIYWDDDNRELYLSNLHRCISDLSTLFFSKKVRKEQGINHFILAGDWNSSPQFEEAGVAQKNFFERLFLFGLKDCTGSLSFKNGRLEENGYTKTFFGKNAASDIQDDWFFADGALYDTLKKTAGTYEKINCSDHYPIIAEFDS